MKTNSTEVRAHISSVNNPQRGKFIHRFDFYIADTMMLLTKTSHYYQPAPVYLSNKNKKASE